MKGAQFGEVSERLRRWTVQIRTQGGGTGSGLLWEGGRVLTNAHVLRARE